MPGQGEKTPRKKSLEREIETSILEFLHAKRLFAWKNENQGTFDQGKGSFRKSHTPFKFAGISDIFLILPPSGQLCTIEVKTPEALKWWRGQKGRVMSTPMFSLRTEGGKPDKKAIRFREQQTFIDNVKRRGGVAFFADSIECVEENLSEFL